MNFAVIFAEGLKRVVREEMVDRRNYKASILR